MLFVGAGPVYPSNFVVLDIERSGPDLLLFVMCIEDITRLGCCCSLACFNPNSSSGLLQMIWKCTTIPLHVGRAKPRVQVHHFLQLCTQAQPRKTATYKQNRFLEDETIYSIKERLQERHETLHINVSQNRMELKHTDKSLYEFRSISSQLKPCYRGVGALSGRIVSLSPPPSPDSKSRSLTRKRKKKSKYKKQKAQSVVRDNSFISAIMFCLTCYDMI